MIDYCVTVTVWKTSNALGVSGNGQTPFSFHFGVWLVCAFMHIFICYLIVGVGRADTVVSFLCVNVLQQVTKVQTKVEVAIIPAEFDGWVSYINWIRMFIYIFFFT